MAKPSPVTWMRRRSKEHVSPRRAECAGLCSLRAPPGFLFYDAHNLAGTDRTLPGRDIRDEPCQAQRGRSRFEPMNAPRRFWPQTARTWMSPLMQYASISSRQEFLDILNAKPRCKTSGSWYQISRHSSQIVGHSSDCKLEESFPVLQVRRERYFLLPPRLRARSDTRWDAGDPLICSMAA
jgi:hypothetical protein